MNKYLLMIVNMLVIVGIMFGLIWLGWKGLIGLAAGMAIMALLILSGNPILMWLVDNFDKKVYVDILRGNDGEEKDADFEEVESTDR